MSATDALPVVGTLVIADDGRMFLRSGDGEIVDLSTLLRPLDSRDVRICVGTGQRSEWIVIERVKE